MAVQRTVKKEWSADKFARRMLELLDYAEDYYSGEPPAEQPRGDALYQCWGHVTYVVACYAAQHLPSGRGGVEQEDVYVALRLPERLSKKERHILLRSFALSLGAEEV